MTVTAKERAAYYRGILDALAVVAYHGQEALYRSIVNTVNESTLIRVARAGGWAHTSGLVRYGYATEDVTQ